MAELISVTADLQHGRVIFRHSDDTESVVSLRGHVAGSKAKPDKATVKAAIIRRAKDLAAQINTIPDERARALKILELKTEETKRKIHAAAENECASGVKAIAGRETHESYMKHVANLCKEMREGAVLEA